MRVTFLGAAGCVTGSRFLVESRDARVLVDCGLFQGYKVLRERNWRPLPFDPSSLDAVLLTHAHVDHSGYLPAAVRDGFRGPILTTAATRDLCGILLPDSARIHEEDARNANRHGFSKHDPALPLYTVEDAERVSGLYQAVERTESVVVGPLTVRFSDAGHILGASSVAVDDGETRVLFSGDLGREKDLLMRPPSAPQDADWVILESTYGDRVHPHVDPLEAVGDPLRRCIERGGVALIPSFAVGRTQALLYALYQLFESGRLPRVPVHVDSPMARDVTALFREHLDEHVLPAELCHQVCSYASFARSVEDSKGLDRPGPSRIIVSASGMLTGGRVLHHLKVFAPNEENLILLPGFQAPGTRGAAIADGAEEVKVHGGSLPVRAEVVQLSILSAHADQDELVAWLGRVPRSPKGVLLVHGEPAALDALRKRAAADLGLDVRAGGSRRSRGADRSLTHPNDAARGLSCSDVPLDSGLRIRAGVSAHRPSLDAASRGRPRSSARCEASIPLWTDPFSPARDWPRGSRRARGSGTRRLLGRLPSRRVRPPAARRARWNRLGRQRRVCRSHVWKRAARGRVER